MKLIEITEIQGKKIKPGQVKLLAKLSSLGLSDVVTEGAERQNPFSGATKKLEPLAVTLHDFIIGQFRANRVGAKGGIPVSVWDRTRYFFLEYWPEEYYALID